MTINDFTNDEKLQYAAIINRIFKNMTTDHFASLMFITDKPEAKSLTKMCSDIMVELLISPYLAEKTPLSKYVWENMSKEKKAFILRKMQDLEETVKGDFTLSFTIAKEITLVLRDLKVASWSHDSSGFHFPDYGVY